MLNKSELADIGKREQAGYNIAIVFEAIDALGIEDASVLDARHLLYFFEQRNIAILVGWGWLLVVYLLGCINQLQLGF